MFFKPKSLLILAFFALMTFTSCENEVIDLNPNSESIFEPNSVLVNLMQSTSANNGSLDDILDNANCLSVNLPVTISVNGLQITINTLDDLELLEDLYEEYGSDEVLHEFLFPITITLNDYNEYVINNQDELEAFIEECSEVDDVIECIDFQYPISFSLYNPNFQIIETVVIENDQQLYLFLQNLENTNNGAVLASLNFPVTMVYANGETIEVNSNQELEAAINAAGDDCDDENEDDCSQEEVSMYLQECYWKIVSYNGDNNFIDYQLYFSENGGLTIAGTGTVAATGNWSTLVNSEGVLVTFSELTNFSQDLGGGWYVVECDDDRLKLVRGSATGANTYIILEQVCDTNTNNCNQGDVSDYLMECGQVPTLNGYTPSFTTFNFLNDNNLSTLYEGDLLFNGTWDITTTQGYVYVYINFSGLEDYNGEWKVVECSDNGLVLHRGNDTLLLTQNCNSNNSFECFESFEAEMVECAESTEGFATFNLTNAYANCIQPAVHNVTYHISHADAESNTNAIPNPSAYTNLSNPQTIYVRVETNEGNFAVFEIGLVVENCTNNCTEEEVDGFLVECIWNIVNYNGDDHLINYDFNFNTDGTVIITGEGMTITAMWSTSMSANGVVVEFSNVAGPNIQAITGNWTVVECQNNRLEFVRANDIMVMERTCN